MNKNKDLHKMMIMIILLGLLIISKKELYLKAIINIARLTLTKSYLGSDSINRNNLTLSENLLNTAKGFPASDYNLAIELGRLKLLECDFETVSDVWKRAGPAIDFQSFFLNSWVVNQATRFCEIEPTCELAIYLWPEYPHAYLRLGSYYFDKKQIKKAITILEEGIRSELTPSFPHKYIQMTFMLARSYYSSDNYFLAEKYFLRTIETDPNNRWMWYTNSSYIYLGDLYAEQGDFEKSAEYYAGSYSIAINDRQRQQARSRIEKLLEKAPNKDLILNIVNGIIHE